MSSRFRLPLLKLPLFKLPVFRGPVFLLLSLSALLAACSSLQSDQGSALPEGWRLVQDVAKDDTELGIAFKKYQLANGLTVLLYPNHDAPLAHVDMTYHVGSAREEEGKSGFAHFFEHMMFQGSKHVGDQEHFRIVHEAGGTLNGTTNKDRTNYYQTVPANQLEKVLWLEADRMGFLLEAVSTRKFEIQRDTVKNERAQRVDNAPYGLLSERVDEALYPREHPYSWQPIGYVEDLNRVGVNDLKDFFLRWYGPNNAVLSIGGDFDEAQTIAWIDKYYSSIPQGPKVEKDQPQPAELDRDRYITLEDRIHVPVLYLSYPTVYMNHPDEVAIDMFSEVLGGGKSSLLYKNLVKTGKALSASSAHYCRELACTLSIYVRANPQGATDLAEIEALVDKSIVEFAEQGVSDQVLQRTRTSLRASTIYSLDNVSDVVSQLSFGEIFLDNPLFVEDILQQYNQVSAAQVAQAYRQYIENKPRVVMSVVPRGQLQWQAKAPDYQPEPRALDNIVTVDEAALVYRPVSDDFDRSIEPSSGPTPQVSLPELWQTELGNGIQLLGSSDHDNATVTLNFRLPGGTLSEPEQQYGIAKFTAQMLMQSTQQQTAAELSDELDALGGSIRFSAGLYSQNIEVRSLSETLPQVLAILEQKLLQPAFDEQEFEREKGRYLQSIAQKFQQPNWLVDIASQRLLYGEESRLATSSWGSKESIESLTLAQVKAFWQRHYQPKGAQLVAVSNLSQADIEQSLQGLSKRWQGEGAAFPHYGERSRAGAPATVYMIDRPGAVQSLLRLGRPAMAYDADGEYFKANLMNYNFGGNFNSRINMNLREDKGYTYGVSSGFSAFKEAGNFIIATGVRGDVTGDAVEQLFLELERYQQQGPNPQEVAYMRSSVSQQEALAYASPGQKAGFLMQLLVYQLSPEFVDKQNQVVSDISQQELADLAQRYFDKQSMLLVVVGDKKLVEPQLKKLGWPIVDYSLN